MAHDSLNKQTNWLSLSSLCAHHKQMNWVFGGALWAGEKICKVIPLIWQAMCCCLLFEFEGGGQLCLNFAMNVLDCTMVHHGPHSLLLSDSFSTWIVAFSCFLLLWRVLTETELFAFFFFFDLDSCSNSSSLFWETSLSYLSSGWNRRRQVSLGDYVAPLLTWI